MNPTLPAVLTVHTPAEALRAAAAFYRDAACDWRLAAGKTAADHLHGALALYAGAAVRFRALAMLRTLVLGSADPGPLASALEGLTGFQMADLLSAAATVEV